MAKARPKASRSSRCNCNPGWLLVGVILLTIGLYGVVAGFVEQFAGAGPSAVLPWYFVGILLIVFGKLSKWKSHAACPVHG